MNSRYFIPSQENLTIDKVNYKKLKINSNNILAVTYI